MVATRCRWRRGTCNTSEREELGSVRSCSRRSTRRIRLAPHRYPAHMRTLLLLRHGESVWNAEGLFTGWVDVGLSELGVKEAESGGRLLAESGLRPDVVHTSVLTRAIATANVTQATADLAWLPVRRSWRLNERHYGALQGKNKAQTREQFGEEQFMLWRRSYDVPPPPIDDDDPLSQAADPRYALLPRDLMPRTECL